MVGPLCLRFAAGLLVLLLDLGCRLEACLLPDGMDADLDLRDTSMRTYMTRL